MKILPYLLLAVFLCTASQSLFGQKNKKWYNEATVELKNGSIIKGELLSLSEDTVKIQILGGSIFVYPQSEVKLVTVSENRTYTGIRTFQYRRTGIHYGILTTANFATEDGGIGLTGVVSHQYNNYLAAGIGVGYHEFSVNNGVRIIPIHLQVSGNLSEKPVTPYYHLGVGYSFALGNPNFDIIDTKGGILIHPALGIRFDFYNGSSMMLDFGYQFQQVEITSQRWNGINIDDIFFRRFSVRLGMMF